MNLTAAKMLQSKLFPSCCELEMNFSDFDDIPTKRYSDEFYFNTLSADR